MAITRLAVSSRNAAADAVSALVDAGSGAGYLEIRTGSMPATPDTSATGTLLGTLTFSSTAFGSASSGVATAASISSDTSADATGTAGWFRVYDSDDNPVADGDITVTSSGGAIEMDSVSIIAGGTIAISAFTLTQPL